MRLSVVFPEQSKALHARAQLQDLALQHVVCIRNALPGFGQYQSPLFLATGRKDDFKNLRGFGCRVWVRPPSIQAHRFRVHARKRIFYGYVPHTDRLFLWWDVETERLRVATHCKFDEGYNDLPTDELPPRFQQILCMNNDEQTPADKQELSSSDNLQFYLYPFANTEIATILVLPGKKNDNFGLSLQNDYLTGRVYVSGIEKGFIICKAFWNKTSCSRFKGFYVTAINGDPVYNFDEATEKLKQVLDHHLAQNQGVISKDFTFELTFASEEKPTRTNLKRTVDDYYDFARGTTKKIKSSFASKDEEELKKVDGDPNEP